jgi:hypothetical protein
VSRARQKCRALSIFSNPRIVVLTDEPGSLLPGISRRPLEIR